MTQEEKSLMVQSAKAEGRATETSTNLYPITPVDLLVMKEDCFCPWCKKRNAYLESWVEHGRSEGKRFITMFACLECAEKRAFCYGVNK